MKYISVKEATKTLGISRSSLYKLINSKALKTYSLPGIRRRTFINKDELELLFKVDDVAFKTDFIQKSIDKEMKRRKMK